MKWIFLIFISACTHSNKNNSIGTESDAKLVSPFSVSPCYCMKIYKPVCANNIPYGNSCEAECNGHKTWKEGHCSKN